MPYVNVKVTKDGLTRAKKAEIVERITTALVEVLGKKPEHTHVVIDAIDDEDWGFAGMLTDEWRRRESRE
ncbi:MAG: 4-oxalocrotonate tautomerase family protein [Planctomycetota bacterium]